MRRKSMFWNKSSEMPTAAWITLLIRISVGPMFLVYGLGKLARYTDTLDFISAGFIESWLPHWLVLTAAGMIPILETLIGLSLTLGLKYRWGLLALGALMALLIFGLAVQGNHEVVARNLMFLLVTIFGLRASGENPFSLDKYLKLDK